MEEKIIVQKPVKSPTLAGIISALFPFGVGPFYNGEIIKGIIYLLIFAGLVTIQQHAASQPFAGIVLGGFYFFQIIDSVNVSRRINRRAMLAEGAEEEEEDVAEAIKAGSVFWGALLIVLGGILLLGNFEVISYEKIIDFWPVIVIVIGIKLVFDYFSRNK